MQYKFLSVGGGGVLKIDEKDVPEAMAQFIFPDNAAQSSATWLGGGAAKTLANTSAFLKEQGRLQEVKPDYNAFIVMSYLKEAMKYLGLPRRSDRGGDLPRVSPFSLIPQQLEATIHAHS